MIDHLGINCTDIERAGAFYDRILGVLGHRRVMDFGTTIGYGSEEPDFWLSTFEGVGPNREVHVAFAAPDAATVRAWYDEAIAAGAESLHEPRLWPEYHERYFGAFVRDTEGNNIEAVCHSGE
ncbi:VOC family protein [Nocardioides seonyuensis]|uniref:VOC family protein n=1 Tax=Nocardioides seonyuensis TaxID=2518371 RepID=A0A4P7IHS1_9ACTN|nr:VOC family protein [Nocardioides seonyuensis]QBX56253.1 VOC family protein [Nocardioides seonyuensis]